MKKCSHPDCNNPVFSHNFCKYHYRYVPKKSKKEYPHKSSAGPNDQSQLELFNKIWNSRPHKSELSGQPLDQYTNGAYFIWMFAHVLDKKNWPLFKFEEENIILVSPEEHRLIDFGTCDQRMAYNDKVYRHANWDIFYQRKEYLKVKYTEFAKQIL